MSAWVIAGGSTGEFTLLSEGYSPVETDQSMRMGAAGLKGLVMEPAGPGGLALNLRTDAMWMWAETDATAGLVATQAHATRVRAIIEAVRERPPLHRGPGPRPRRARGLGLPGVGRRAGPSVSSRASRAAGSTDSSGRKTRTLWNAPAGFARRPVPTPRHHEGYGSARAFSPLPALPRTHRPTRFKREHCQPHHTTQEEFVMSDRTLRDGRSLGTLTSTFEDDECTWELLLDPEISATLHDYVLVSMQACLELPNDHWRALGFEGAVFDLLFQTSTLRNTRPHEDLVRLFTIDEAEHGPIDVVIDEIHAALRRIEESREMVRKTRAYLARFDSNT